MLYYTKQKFEIFIIFCRSRMEWTFWRRRTLSTATSPLETSSWRPTLLPSCPTLGCPLELTTELQGEMSVWHFVVFLNKLIIFQQLFWGQWSVNWSHKRTINFGMSYLTCVSFLFSICLHSIQYKGIKMTSQLWVIFLNHKNMDPCHNGKQMFFWTFVFNYK